MKYSERRKQLARGKRVIIWSKIERRSAFFMGKRISLCCHFPWKITTHVTTCMSYFAFSVFLEKRYIYLLGRSKRPPAGLWDITIPMLTRVVVKNLTGNNQKIRTFAGSWYHHGHGCLTAYFPVHLLLFDQVKKRLFIFFSLGCYYFVVLPPLLVGQSITSIPSVSSILNCPPFPSQKNKISIAFC